LDHCCCFLEDITDLHIRGYSAQIEVIFYNEMRYINLRFTYLLTVALPGVYAAIFLLLFVSILEV